MALYKRSLGAKKIKSVEDLPDGIWFQHKSHLLITSKLTPLTYTALASARPDYPIKVRIATEKVYHELLPDHDDGVSFLYATPVGYDKMPDALSYPGYTYYFRLFPQQLGNCLFTIVDEYTHLHPSSPTMPLTRGSKGLKNAMKIWDDKKDTMKPYEKKDFGTIDPRVEVVIPFSVTPTYFIPQEEDR